MWFTTGEWNAYRRGVGHPNEDAVATDDTEDYGDASNHLCCPNCGFCIDCGDCKCKMREEWEKRGLVKKEKKNEQ